MLRPLALLLVLLACGRPFVGGMGGGAAGGTGGSAGAGANGGAGGSGGSAAGGAGGAGASGGSGGATGGGAPGGGAGGGFLGPDYCATGNFTEQQCRLRSGCVADTCFTCSCTPTYLGCRGADRPMIRCPEVGCASPLCCRGQAECQGVGVCIVPGGSAGCGVCQPDPGDCTDDSTCASGTICKPVHCSCNAVTRCQPGCTLHTDCADGEVCSGGTHPRCVAAPCSAPAGCGPGFDCTSGTCQRRTCSSDAACGPAGGAYCVQGLCYRSLGTCMAPPP